jgi:hypothetical protein
VLPPNPAVLPAAPVVPASAATPPSPPPIPALPSLPDRPPACSVPPDPPALGDEPPVPPLPGLVPPALVEEVPEWLPPDEQPRTSEASTIARHRALFIEFLLRLAGNSGTRRGQVQLPQRMLLAWKFVAGSGFRFRGRDR